MAKRKKPAQSNQQQSKPGKSGLILQLATLGLVIGLVVYLLVSGFTESDRTPPATASDTVPGSTSGERPVGATPTVDEELTLPPVLISPAVVRFGNVPPNTTLTREVTLTNNGSSPVRIVDVRPTCPCTKVQRGANTINPGRSITLNIEMDSEARLGQKSVSVHVMFSGYNPMNIPIVATVVEDPA